MTTLFLTFDPQSWFYLNLNWTLFLLLFLAAFTLLAHEAQTKCALLSVLNSVKQEFAAACGSVTAKNALAPVLSLFFLVLFLNIPGLMPYTFTLTAHLSATAALALPLWVGHVVVSTILCPTTLIAHVVPLGAPAALIPFMVLIELISNVIRPLTLSVRLAANMIAGHLLISLLGQALYPSFSLTLSLTLAAMFFLCILESGVSVIQAYVLSLLSSLYVNELQSPTL